MKTIENQSQAILSIIELTFHYRNIDTVIINSRYNEQNYTTFEYISQNLAFAV